MQARDEHEVVIAGGGPTGMMLAAELALAGIDVAVIERRRGDENLGSRAGGLHARTIEVLDQRGVVDRFLSEGYTAQVSSFADVPLDISDFPSRHPYALALWQNRFEEILAGWVTELPVAFQRERAVTAFTPDGDGVDVQLADGASIRARYLVGCDGGRSLVRKAAGIDFVGWEPTMSSLVAEVHMSEEPDLSMRRDDKGIHAIGRLEGDRYRLVVRDEHLVRNGGDPTADELSDALVAVYGTDYGLHDVTWLSRFTDATRQAAAYRSGRILLAGDAAHVHSPVGGQGLNTGVQDAVNLGWKLAQVVRGASPDSLLDTYHAERHPIGARVLRMTMAQTALMPATDRIDALRETIGEAMHLDEPRKRFGGRLSGLDVHYDLGEGHPLLGRRMPDLDLITLGGERCVFTFLHHARPVLFDFSESDLGQASPWTDRVQLVNATYDDEWELPVLGTVPAPAAVLVRPDGHVAWVGDRPDGAGLTDALTTWFGP